MNSEDAVLLDTESDLSDPHYPMPQMSRQSRYHLMAMRTFAKGWPDAEVIALRGAAILIC
ncbi:hypothetical protein [Cupriavidus sp. PET2-C1]